MSATTQTIRVTARVELPTGPNFFRCENEADGTIDIADVDDDGLRLIGEAWVEDLLARALLRRRGRGEPNAEASP